MSTQWLQDQQGWQQMPSDFGPSSWSGGLGCTFALTVFPAVLLILTPAKPFPA